MNRDDRTRGSDDLAGDETQLRARLDVLRETRPKVEAYNQQLVEFLQELIGKSAALARSSPTLQDAQAMEKALRQLTELMKGGRQAYVDLGEEEARVRQAINHLTTERMAAAATRAANSTKWATWAAALVAAAALVVALTGPSPAPAAPTPPAAISTP